MVKKYKDFALETIAQTNQSVEQHTRKVIQMHCLAQNFACQLAAKVIEEVVQKEFGNTIVYGDIYLGKKGEECFTIEEFVPGNFRKFVNNDGSMCDINYEDEIDLKAGCLAHFSYEKTNKELILLDIQGCDHKMIDPEIASAELTHQNEYLFTTGNLSTFAMEKFCQSHRCNRYCTLIKLAAL